MKQFYALILIAITAFYVSSCKNNTTKNENTPTNVIDNSWKEIKMSNDTTVIVKDYTHDGINDTIYKWFDGKVDYDGTIGYGGQNVILINGKTKIKYSLSIKSKESNIRYLLSYPEFKDSLVSSVLLNEILPEKKATIDPSLEWIIRLQTQTKKQLRSLSDVMCLPLKWYKGHPAQPTNYSIKIDNDSLCNILSAKNSDWLVYYGQFHKNPTKIQETPYGTIYSTEVGLILQKNNEYAWILVSDTKVTFDVKRKIWSRKRDNLYYQDGYIIAQIGDYSMNMIMIDLRKGLYGKIATSFYGDVPNKLIVDGLGKKLSAAN